MGVHICVDAGVDAGVGVRVGVGVGVLVRVCGWGGMCALVCVHKLQAGEEVKNESSEQLLLRWMNYHLKKANYSKEVTNFGSDIKVSGPGTSAQGRMGGCHTVASSGLCDLLHAACS